MTIPYLTGTVSIPAGSKTVTGAGTAWATALIVGGVFFCNGLAVPIASIDGDTQLTLSLGWPGAAVNAKPYAIVRDTDYARQSVANATALAEYIRRLDNETLQALASILTPAGKESLPLLLGEGSAALLPLADLLTRLGVSDFGKTLLANADVSAAQTTLGVSNFGKVLLATASGADGWKKLGASAGFGGNGWYRFPDGLIIQWGVENSPYADNLRAFPIAFPSVNYGVFATPLFSSDAADAAVMFVGATTTTSFVTYRRYISPSGQPSRNSNVWAYWLAIGR